MRTSYIKNIFFILIFFTGTALYGQTGSIKGRMFDKISNEPLAFGNVIIQGTTIAAVSDLEGNFTFKGLKPGFIRLEASYVGYRQTLSAEIQVTNAKEAYVEIALDRLQTQIGEVVVKASPYRKVEESPVSMKSIGLSEIESNPGSNRDISKVIQSFPGVGTTVAFRNDIIIRGGGPSESRYYLDGVEIPNLNHFATQGASGGPVGIINSDFIRNVNYFSGAFPANRGNALSGVFEFFQIDGNKEKLKFRGTLGASELSLTTDGPIGDNTSFIFSVRRSYLQFLFDLIGLPFLPTFTDYQFKLRSRIDAKNELTIVSIGALDKFKLNLGIENPDATQKYILASVPVNNQWSYAIGGVYKHYAGDSYQTVVLSRNMLDNQRYKYPDNDESQERILDYTSQEIENKIRFENTSRLKGYKINLGLGGEYAKYYNDTYQKIYANDQLYTIDYDSELNMFKWNAFGQVSKRYFGSRLLASIGFRMDANDYSESMSNMLNQFSPRASLSYSITENINLTANTGRYFQLPAYTTLGYRDNNGMLKNKENNLKYIQSDHFIAGMEWLPKENITTSLEGFYKLYSNYPFSIRDSISLANKGGGFGVLGDEEVLSISEGRAYGFEISHRSRFDNTNNPILKDLNTIVSYTFVRSQFKNFDGDYIPSAWDSRHILSLTASKKFKNDWMLGLKWRFVGGLPYTPYDLETSALRTAWDSQGGPFLDYDRYNAERLSSFHQLDFRIDKKFFFETWSLMLYFDIQNAYNYQAEQQDYIVRSEDDAGNFLFNNNGTEYLLERLPTSAGQVLPTIGIMVEF